MTFCIKRSDVRCLMAFTCLQRRFDEKSNVWHVSDKNCGVYDGDSILKQALKV